MKPIDEQHIAEPGLVVLDITGGDEDTIRAVMAALEDRWATSGVDPDAGIPASRPRRRSPSSPACWPLATAGAERGRGSVLPSCFDTGSGQGISCPVRARSWRA
ncbi:DUF6207 family protein [Streptomyces sp. NPDC006670]|uniref:DUF6207 family protein n=1 Tax=Streptomyces sp. NPDC006670 TaxID=3154476 RepID=UPI0033C23BE2